MTILQVYFWQNRDEVLDNLLAFVCNIWQIHKNYCINVGDPGSIPGSGRSPGKGNVNPLQYSCLENPTDGGAWWATVHGVAKSQT